MFTPHERIRWKIYDFSGPALFNSADIPLETEPMEVVARHRDKRMLKSHAFNSQNLREKVEYQNVGHLVFSETKFWSSNWEDNLYISRSHLKNRLGFYIWKCFSAPWPGYSVMRMLLQGEKDKEMILYVRWWVQFEIYLIWGALGSSELKPLVGSWEYKSRTREV